MSSISFIYYWILWSLYLLKIPAALFWSIQHICFSYLYMCPVCMPRYHESWLLLYIKRSISIYSLLSFGYSWSSVLMKLCQLGLWGSRCSLIMVSLFFSRLLKIPLYGWRDDAHATYLNRKFHWITRLNPLDLFISILHKVAILNESSTRKGVFIFLVCSVNGF